MTDRISALLALVWPVWPILKVLKILGWLILLLPCSVLIKLMVREPGPRAKWLGVISGLACGKIVAALGVRVKIKGHENIPDPKVENFLIVSNHLSYIDPLVSFGLFPSVFVTSVEIQNTPLLGTLCDAAGCVFIERRTIWNLPSEVKQLADALRHGRNVVFYPEGTTSDGSGVLPFRTSLFQAAIDAKRRILPITINVDRVDGDPATARHKDVFCWYGDMGFAPHFMEFLKLRSVDLTVTFHPPVQPDDAVNSRKRSAKIIRTEIKNEFRPLAPLRADAI